MLIRSVPKKAWLFICPPSSPPRARLVGASCLSPHRRPRRAPSLPASLTCVPVTYAVCSLVVRPSPIAVRRTADLAMVAGAHVQWRLGSSLAEPRASTSVAGAGGARVPPLAVASHPTTRIDRPRPSLSYVANVCFKCFRCFRDMLQLLHTGDAKVDRDVAHIAYFCKCFSGMLQAS
jgi:hypothetical protein